MKREQKKGIKAREENIGKIEEGEGKTKLGRWEKRKERENRGKGYRGREETRDENKGRG